MIRGSISWFIADKEDVDFVVEFTKGYKFNVELGFYELKDLDLLNDLLDVPSEYISSIHLPKGLTHRDYIDDKGIVKNLAETFDVDMFVVHPWATDLFAIAASVVEMEEYCLCLETFRSKKTGQGNPFRLLADFGKHFQTDWMGLCLDFSHLAPELCHFNVLKYWLPYTKVIHASGCADGKQQHVPIFLHGSEINAVSVIGQTLAVKNLKVREIVLEYMKQYKEYLVRNIFWLNSSIQEKRRKWGTDREKKELEV